MVKKYALALAVGLLFASTANAQRVIPAGELPASPGTYFNTCAETVNVGSLATTSVCGTLITTGLMRLSSGAAWEAARSATALASSSGIAAGTLLVEPINGISATLNVTAATVIKATPGRVYRVSVVVAGVAGALHNVTTTGAAVAANQVAAIPAVVGIYEYNWPMTAGIVLVPGAGQTLAISFH